MCFKRSTLVPILRNAAILIIGIMLSLATAQAQTLQVIHNFTGGLDGANPAGQLVADSAGNLYVGAYNGGMYGFGTVIKLKDTSGGWTIQPLYSFQGGNDGEHAYIMFSSNGSIYGASNYGGGAPDCGTVFQLRPPPTFPRTPLTPWGETILYRFAGGSDGCNPWAAPIADSAGNLYGMTVNGGAHNGGTVYELVNSGGNYTEQVLYSLCGVADGCNPYVGLVADSAFNLYGVTIDGGAHGYGIVFRLRNSGSGWAETILYNFQNGNDGRNPNTGLILDSAGNLYGSTQAGGVNGGGTIFKLTPSGGFSVLAGLTGVLGPQNGYLTMDASGNIYGTTQGDGANGLGSVFELTPSGGGYTYADLHDFTGGSDGSNPYGGVIVGLGGNLYGTASAGGTGSECSGGCGVVWEITNP